MTERIPRFPMLFTNAVGANELVDTPSKSNLFLSRLRNRMSNDCLQLLGLGSTWVAQVDLVMKAGLRDGSATIERFKNLLRTWLVPLGNVEAKTLACDEFLKPGDCNGFIVVGAHVHDLRAWAFGKANETQTAEPDGGL